MHPHPDGRPTIGVLAGWQFYRTATNLSYLAPVFRGISRAAQDLGCNLLLGCGLGPSASPSDPLRPAWPDPLPDVDFIPIGPWNTDGILIANPLHSPARSAYIQQLISEGYPVLFLGSGENGPTIVADNVSGIREALQHLVDHGHRQIAFIAGTREDLSGDSGDRLAAYRSFLESNRLEIDPRRIAYGRHVYDGGTSAMRQILESAVPFTAVLASNDESALGAMQALKEAGRRIPQDVAVIGFDNRLEGAVHEPALSSVHVPLFHMGYQALQQMMENLSTGQELGGILKVETRLVTRESCGCRQQTGLPAQKETNTKSGLAKAMSAMILSQAHGLTDEKARLFCERLVEAFEQSLQRGDGSKFETVLVEVLRHSTTGEDDAHIWQEAISVLGIGSLGHSANLAQEILDAARRTISEQMQRQYRQYVLRERWTSSRLSLLTDSLLDALDETQIYETLARYLPELDIHVAMLGLFEGEGADPVTWTVLRNATVPKQPPVCFASREFPPPGLFDEDRPFQLTLIPLVGHSGQMGFVAFGTEQLDLYGAIVQQLGGAFDTARLYRQAVEGRQAAEEASRLKSRFLSTISHELRTPLNLIVGLSGIVLRENEEETSTLPEPVRRDVERIHAYAQHLGGLIGDVLDLATSDAGQLRLNMEYLELREALSLVSESGRQLASDKGLTWRQSFPEESHWVWGDRTRLRQVALNLVNNAVKFTTRGQVSLTVEAGDATITVSVRDTGLGIPWEEQSAIFSEFSRSERSISLGYRGLGLGLAICKRLVEMHGGTIGVRSTGEEGAGSTFYFTLPAASLPPDQAGGEVVSALEEEKTVGIVNELIQAIDPLGRTAVPDQPVRTILVVDDEPNTLDLHVRILQSYLSSARILKAHTGWEALKLLGRETVDLVLLDLQMPELDGFGVLDRMHEHEEMRKIPVIVLTGQMLTETEMSRLTRGVVTVLEKGLFSIEETVAHIHDALERKQRLGGETQRLVRKAMAFIHEHYASPISRRDIARHVNIAEDYLTYCFRQELGTTPIKYLQRYRVNRAKSYLREQEYTVTEIARMIGFSDSSYFSRIFHRETGMSPEAFRRS